MEQKQYIYDAFISYRHADLDKFVAENLHKRLERFKLPRNVIKHKAIEKTTINRVFRDTDELPITNNLEDPIIQAISKSEYLIVICSPRIKESEWCRKEIQTFIEMHGREKIFAVLIEGEPEDTFPKEMTESKELVINSDGTTSIVEKTYEPLAADFRGKTKKDMLKAMDHEIIRLVAPMFGLNYDDLKQRHREQKIRRRIGYALAVGSMGVVFGLYGSLTAIKLHNQKLQIERQADLLRAEQAKNLVKESRELYESGDRNAAIELCYSALTSYEGIDMPKTEEAIRTLADILGVYEAGEYVRAVDQIEMPGTIIDIKMLPGKRKVMVYDSLENITVWDMDNKEKIYEVSCDESIIMYDYLDDNNIIYCTAGKGIIKVNLETGENCALNIEMLDNDREFDYDDVMLFTFRSSLGAIVSPDRKKVFCIDFEGYKIIDVDSLSVEISKEYKFDYVEHLMFSENGDYIYIVTHSNNKNMFLCIDAKSGNVKFELDDIDSRLNYFCSDSDDTIYLIAGGYEGIQLESTKLYAIDKSNAAIRYCKEYDSFVPYDLFYCEANKNKYLFSWDSNQLIMIDEKNGDIKRIFNVSFLGKDNIKCSDQALYIYNTEGYVDVISLESASKLISIRTFYNNNVRQFCVGENETVGYINGDNRLLFFYRLLSPGAEPLETEGYYIDYVNFEKSDHDECVAWADEHSVPRVNYISGYIELEDADITLVHYRDNRIKLYRTSTMELLSTYDDIYDGQVGYYGTCNGYHVIDISGKGYLFDDDGVLFAEINSIVGIDRATDKLVISGKNDDNEYQNFLIPVYTVDELLDIAKDSINN